MSALVEMAYTLSKEVGPGNEFELAKASELRPEIVKKTVDNRVAELVQAGVLARTARGKYVVLHLPPLEMEARIIELGPRGYESVYLNGERKPPKKYEGQVRKLNATAREPLYRGQAGVCAICGMDILHVIHAAVDHYRPIADGGEDAPGNLVVVHEACNAAKGKRSREQTQDYLEFEKHHPMDRERAQQAFDRGIAMELTVPASWVKPRKGKTA